MYSETIAAIQIRRILEVLEHERCLDVPPAMFFIQLRTAASCEHIRKVYLLPLVI